MDKNKKIGVFGILFFLVLILVVVFGQKQQEQELARYQASFLDVFDTKTDIVGYSTSEEAFTEQVTLIKEKLEYYHKLYDIYNEYEGINNIKTINDHAGIEPVEVSQEIIDLLLFSKEMYEKTNGQMNIAMGSVLEIWHDYRDEGLNNPQTAELPPIEDLQEAAKYCDIHQIVIDVEAGTVYLPNVNMSIDVGSIGKGYAVQKIAEYAKEIGGRIIALSGFGGYIESSSIGNRGYRNGQQLRYAHYTIRVSADRLDEFLNAVSGLGNVTSVNTSLRDVTTNYVDSEKHLESLRVEQQALLEILAKAETVEDIITVQDRLTQVRYEIESYEAILRTYDDQIALSTVSLNINEVEKETPVEKETFGQEVSRRFKESLENVGEFFRNLGAWLFGSAPELIVILAFFGLQALIIVLIVKGAKRSARKRREKAQKAREAQNNTPKE